MILGEYVVVQEVHQFQTDDDHCGSCCGHDEHAGTCRHADGCCHPQSGGCGQSADGVLLEDNAAGTYKTDARHHLGSNARHVVAGGLVNGNVAEAVGRQNHKQAATQSHQEMGTETGFLSPVFTLETDGTAKQSGDKNAEYKFSCHNVGCKGTKII